MAALERESMDFDVVIVGAGPAGLAAAIRLKQLAPHLSVFVVEKGATVGAHIVSGAVLDPAALDHLLPQWRAEVGVPHTPVTQDRFNLLTRRHALSLPSALLPPLMGNHGNVIVSLGATCAWMADQAEMLGVEVYPGFAATELLRVATEAVVGIATGDMGLNRDGTQGRSFTPGMALMGKYVLLAEGARGSLSKLAIAQSGLSQGRQPQKFGPGFKEIWKVDPGRHQPGLIEHSFGWPLPNAVGSGSFVYHWGENLVSVGFVVHLDYADPELSPFELFQKFKTHPRLAELLDGARRLSYGARAHSEGGYQSVPRLVFPGGALLGCSAGLVNVPRIKGIHNAMSPGMQAAAHVAVAIAEGRSGDVIEGYEEGWRDSDIGRDPSPARNVKPLWSRLGTLGGIAVGGLEMWASHFGLSPLGTLSHPRCDHATLKPRRPGVGQASAPTPSGMVAERRLTGSPRCSSPISSIAMTSPHICWCRICRCSSGLSMPSSAGLRHTTARRVSMSGPKIRMVRIIGSTRRTAFIARPATSRILTRTSTGSHLRVGLVPTMSTCDGTTNR